MIRVYNADAVERMAKMPPNSVDLVLTDPEYNQKDISEIIAAMKRVLKRSGSMYICGNPDIVNEHWFSQVEMPFKTTLIWYYKNSPKAKGRWRKSYQSIIYAHFERDAIFNEDDVRIPYQENTKKLHGRMRPSKGRLGKPMPYDTSKGALPRDVIEVPALLGHLSKERVGHPHQKPEALFEKLLLASSNPGDIVLDCCAGSGTTGIVCLKHKRKCILIEKEKEHCKRIRYRIKKLKNQLKTEKANV